MRSLASARKSAANFARQTYEATLAVRGAAKSVAEMDAVDEKADALDGRNVDLRVDDSGSVSTLSEGFKGLASNIRATGTVLRASAIPFAIAGIGAATPTVFALGASLAGLALNLSKAAAGFGLVGAAAGGGALAGLKAYSALISSTLSDSRELWEEENEKAVEALEKQRYEILTNARGFDAYNKQLNRSLLGFTHLQAAVGSRVFPTFTRELEAWTDKLREMRPFIADTAGSIANVAAGFSEWFRTAEDGQVLREVVGFLSESAMRGAQTIALLGRAGISAFRPLIPLATGLQKAVLGVARETGRWVESSRGQERLGEIYRGLYADARRLLPVVKDLAGGVVNLFSALDRSGVADQASRGFARLADAFERGTRRGSGLYGFLRGVYGLMPFVGRAAGDVARTIFGIADAAISAREQGDRLTILQRIFQGISRAAQPLRRLVVGTFRDLGPEIARLIPELSRFFSTFAGSSGPLVAFVRVIRRALEIFNDLPQPIKQAAVNLAALKLILGTLGVGAVVAPMGRFASNMLIARGAANKLAGKSALLGVAGGLARIATVAAGGIGLGLIAAGLVRAYNKNEDFRNSVNRLADKIRPAFSRIQTVIDKKVLPALGRLADKGANAIIDIFDLNDNQKNKIRKNGMSATAQFGLGVRQQAKKVPDGDWVKELGRKIGQGVGAGLNAWAKGGGGEGGNWLSRILSSNSNPVRFGQRLGQGFKQGMNKVDYRSVGERIYRQLGNAATNPAAKNFIQKKIGDAWRAAVKAVNWPNIANLLVRLFFAPMAPFMDKKSKERIVKPIAKSLRQHPWKSVGEAVASGIWGGFSGFGLPGKIAEAVANVRKAIGKRIQAHSPARLFYPDGRNIGMGILKGFSDLNLGKRMADNVAGELRDGIVTLGDVPKSVWDKLLKRGWKGNPRDNAERLYRPHRLDDGFRANSRQSANRGRPGYVQAEDGSWVPRSFYGGGGRKPLDEDGMRRIMREHRQESARGGGGVSVEQAAVRFVVALERALPGFIDGSLGGYLQHHNGAGADPR